MNKISLLPLAGLLLLSCTKEVEIDLPVHEPKLVVFSTIVPLTLPYPKPLSVSLQQTSLLTDTSTYRVSDAKILYFENNILVDTLTYSDSTGTYPISKSMQDYPFEGNSYAIKVLREGFEPVTASTTVPSKVEIINANILPVAYFDEDGLAYSEVSVTFDDPPHEVNFYELAISGVHFLYDKKTDFRKLSTTDNLITSENYYPSLIRFDLKKPQYLLFSDKKINGDKYTLNVSFLASQIESDRKYICRHDIVVHLRNVTKEYYQFKTTLIQHQYDNQEDFLYGMSEPLNVVSNTSNGYGLFAGYNADIISLHIEEQVIEE